MSTREPICATSPALPRWLRVAVLVASTIILCSCRATHTASHDPFKERETLAVAANDPPQNQLASHDVEHPHSPENAAGYVRSDASPIVLASATMPGPPAPGLSFSPAGCECHPAAGTGMQYKLPPLDEVLCDGGDAGLPAAVVRDGTVVGLELQDTVAHYRTLQGQTVIVPTNEVCIYAPRFGSVRQVSGASVNVERRGAEGVAADLGLVAADGRHEPSTTLQHHQPAAGVAERPSSLLLSRQQSGGLENDQGISRMSGQDIPFAHRQALLFALVDNRDLPLSVGGMINAIHWTHDLGVQVVIDHKKAQVVASDRQAAFLYHVDEPHHPSLKIEKLADRAAARPGDVVNFMLRYQNTGNRPIGELTIIDNLTTRLAYVDDSQQSDRPAEFSTELNDGGSLILRWEIQQLLEPGQGGVIQFQTRVR